MSRFLALAVLLTIAISLFTSCSILKTDNVTGTNAQANSSSGTSAGTQASTSTSTSTGTPTGTSTGTSTDTPAGTSADTSLGTPAGTNPVNSTASESSVQDIAAAAENPVDDSITYELVKKAAQDAGYTVEDIQDIRQREEPNPVRGFFLNYKDENSQSQSPIYEFKSSEEAQEYAGKVNEQGYSLCIVNGKLLCMTGSKYGIVLNDQEKAVLETLLKSKVMTYKEPTPPPVSSDKDFAGDCTRIGAIHTALDTLVNKSVLVYAKSHSGNDPNINMGTVSFSMVSSSDMAYIATLSEDQAKMDAVVKTWEMYGCTNVKLKHDTANNYILSGKRAGMDTSFTINCAYSPDKDSLRIFDKDGSQIADFFEFVPLGEDKYAIQTLYERAIVGYKDGKITSLIYSLKARIQGTEYNTKADSIYPDGTGIDTAWVSKLGEDKYEQFITFDGTTLKISAVDFTGAKLKAEINVR